MSAQTSAKRRRPARPRYMPLDQWLESPRAKILRALRWFDWVDNEDLSLAIGVPDWSEDKRRRDAHYQMLQLLVREGAVQRRGRPGAYLYRLASRSVLQRELAALDPALYGADGGTP